MAFGLEWTPTRELIWGRNTEFIAHERITIDIMVSMTFLHRHNHKDWVTQAIHESKSTLKFSLNDLNYYCSDLLNWIEPFHLRKADKRFSNVCTVHILSLNQIRFSLISPRCAWAPRYNDNTVDFKISHGIIAFCPNYLSCSIRLPSWAISSMSAFNLSCTWWQNPIIHSLFSTIMCVTQNTNSK